MSFSFKYETKVLIMLMSDYQIQSSSNIDTQYTKSAETQLTCL